MLAGMLAGGRLEICCGLVVIRGCVSRLRSPSQSMMLEYFPRSLGDEIFNRSGLLDAQAHVGAAIVVD